PWIWCFKAAHRLVQVRAGSGTVNQTKSRVAIAVGAIVMFAGGCGSSGVATASETAPTSQAELSWTTTDLGPAEFNAVACSTRISCVALGPYGWVAWSDDGGAKWTTGRVTTLDNSTINSVVCPSANRCVAIGVENETR